MQSKVFRLAIYFICFIVATSGCLRPESADLTPAASGDIPIAEFIIGKWKSEKALDQKGNIIMLKYEIEFLKDNTIKLAIFKENGEFLDGVTADYSFVDTNRIYFDDPRIRNGETWLLEREGQKLVIYRMIAGETDVLYLARY